uniref:hypothetical protein n=1 Tax=Flavobacterium sp. TaxID=239 RepID=UPI004047D083
MATQWTAQGISAGAVLPASTLQSIGAPWVDYTPTLTQGVTVTKTVVQARYCQFQKTIIGQALLNTTSAGTAATLVAIGLPFAVKTGQPMTAFGYIYDSNTNTIYNLTFVPTSDGASTVNGFYQTGNPFGVSPAITLATSDQIAINFSYEIA